MFQQTENREKSFEGQMKCLAGQVYTAIELGRKSQLADTDQDYRPKRAPRPKGQRKQQQ